MRLHFQVQGEGRPLIILHGFLGSLDNWRVMSKRLANGYKVYSLDLRNHGRSPHSEVMNYPVMAQDVIELIAEHGLTAPSVLGHSMGGKVAMQLATQIPKELDKLVVVDIAPKAYPPVHGPMLQAMSDVDLHACKSFGEVGDALSTAVPDPTVRQFIIKNLTRDADGKFQWRIALRAIRQNYHDLTRAVAFDEHVLLPACFIRGARSDFIGDSDLASIRQVFPDAEFKTIAKAGHWVHIDAPDEFHTMVTKFLNAPSRSGRPAGLS